jgi:hypothetical protein
MIIMSTRYVLPTTSKLIFAPIAMPTERGK